MAKQDDQLTDRERLSPEIVQRYIKKYRDTFKAGAARNIPRSRKWFKQRIAKDVGKINPSSIMRAGGYERALGSKRALIGRLIYLHYDAIHKDTLDVWDMRPLIFPFNSYSKDGNQYITAINLHFIPPKVRLKLFVSLMELRNEKRFRETTRLKMSWEILRAYSRVPGFAGAIRTYRADHILDSRIIPAQDWEIALWVAVPRFVSKGSAVSRKSAWAHAASK